MFCSIPAGGSQQEATPSDNAGCAEIEIAEQPALPEHTTLGQWLRTCASATDLEVASVMSVAPSQASSANGDRAAPGKPSPDSHEKGLQDSC